MGNPLSSVKKMPSMCRFLVAIAATFHLAVAQTVSGPGQESGTNYFWPRYNYTNADLKYTSKMTLSSPYVCKWDVTVPGMNMNQGILVLPPCQSDILDLHLRRAWSGSATPAGLRASGLCVGVPSGLDASPLQRPVRHSDDDAQLPDFHQR